MGPKPEPPEQSKLSFFIDDCLSSAALIDRLQKLGHLVVRNESLGLKRDTPDEEWIPLATKAGHIILTKDARIRQRAVERAAYRIAGAAVFFLTSADINGERIAETFQKLVPKIEKLVRSHNRPLIVMVTKDGKTTVEEGVRRGGIKK